MSVNVCPIAIVRAPMDKVWQLMSEPANFALWWDARTESIRPPGRARAGQQIRAHTSGLPVLVTVNGVSESDHHIELTTQLPFGITVFNHITFKALPDSTTQVAFG
jgi:uncharacterized protein YndB with AHSA1/START domain